MNMSYCRYQNTLPDFLDCMEAMQDFDPAEREANDPELRAFKSLLQNVVAYAEECQETLDYMDEDKESES